MLDQSTGTWLEGEPPGLVQDMLAIRKAALNAVDPGAAVRRWMVRDGNILHIGTLTWDLSAAVDQEQIKRIFMIAVGKAAPGMAQAVVEILGECLSAGLIVTRYGHAQGFFFPGNIQVIESGHPVPDENGLIAAEKIVDLLENISQKDRVLVLLSGGASALIPYPVPPLTLQDLQEVTRLLLQSGANIGELNAVRKHLDGIKGGQLARLAAPAVLVSLILSDVVGDSLDVIASGPTAPDASTYAQAWSVLEKYFLLEQTSTAIIAHLREGVAGRIAETPKPGDVIFGCTSNMIVGSNHLAAEAARVEAVRLGYHSLLLTTYLEGEAREVGKVIAALVKGVVYNHDPIAAPACLVLGGETTVTMTGSGYGGRNQELALAAALGIDGLENVSVMCLATDGSDGPTDAAGAIVNGGTIRGIRAGGLDPAALLATHNSYLALQAANSLIYTGPTGTNVNDLVVILVC